MARNKVGLAVGVKDDASGSLDRIRDKFEKLRKQGAKGFGIGVGAAVTAKGIGLVSDAMSRLGDVAGDAIDAAIEEERSIARLGAALEANIEDWDGNTEAIERTLAKRIELGFADDEQRDSLAMLVAVTKDSTKALDLQRIAMDLARLRGIDLAAASDIVGKVYGGNIGILSRYGIQLEKGISSTEALAEIQKRAAGQAEAYAETTAGKLLVAQTEVGEAMEKFGGVTLPLVADAAGAAADVVTGLASAFEILNGKTPQTKEDIAEVEQGFIDMFDALSGVPLIGAPFAAAREAMDATKTTIVKMDKPIEGIQDSFDDMAETAEETTGEVGQSFTEMVDLMVDNVDRMIDEVFDPIETRADIYQERMEQNAAEERLRDAETAREKREATDDIMASIRRQADGLKDLGDQGELTAEDIDRFEKDVKQSYKALGKQVPKEIQAIIDALRKLDKWDGHKVNVDVNAYIPNPKGGGKGHLAHGGPGSGMTLVGEQGPEVVDLPPGSFVHNAQSQVTKAAIGGAAVYNFNLTVQGDIKARDGEEILRTMRRLEAVSKPIGAWNG